MNTRILDLMSQGAACYPLAPNGFPPKKERLPTGYPRSGQHLATRNWDEFCKIRDWLNRGYATGISAYGVRGGEGLALIDLDTKDDRDGVERFNAFCEERGWTEAVINTLIVATPSGGLHVYLKVPEKLQVPTGTCMDGLIGVDFRGYGGWVVGPGSVTPKGEYQLVGGTTILDAPADMAIWIAQAKGVGMAGGNGGGSGGGMIRFFSYAEAVEHWTPWVKEWKGCIPQGVQNNVLVECAWGAACDALDFWSLEGEEAVQYVIERIDPIFNLCVGGYSKETPEEMARRQIEYKARDIKKQRPSTTLKSKPNRTFGELTESIKARESR